MAANDAAPPGTVIYEDTTTNDTLGAVTGRLNAVIYSPNVTPGGASPALFIGSAGGGIWRTTNIVNGAVTNNPTWQQVTDGRVFAPTDLTTPLTPEQAPGVNVIGTMTVDESNPRNIWAGTGDPNSQGDAASGAGILKSTDGGTTWTLLGRQFAGYSIAKIVVDPRDSNTAYAAVVPTSTQTDPLLRSNLSLVAGASPVTMSGVWVTYNGGQTWDRLAGLDAILAGPRAIVPTALDYVRAPGNILYLYAGLGNLQDWGAAEYNPANSGVYRIPLADPTVVANRNPGTWQFVDTDVDNNTIARIGLAADHVKQDGSALMYIAYVNTNSALSALRKSYKASVAAINSDDWATIEVAAAAALISPGTPNLRAHLSIGLDPKSNADWEVVYLGGEELARTRNGGAIWEKPFPENETNPDEFPNHVDHHAWAFSPGTGLFSTAYDANDGGIWRLSRPGFNANFSVPLNTDSLSVTTANSAAAYRYANGRTVYLAAAQDNGLSRWQDNDPAGRWVKAYYPFGDGGLIRFNSAGDAVTFRYGGKRHTLVSSAATQNIAWRKVDATGLPPLQTGDMPATFPDQFDTHSGLAVTANGTGFYLGGHRLYEGSFGGTWQPTALLDTLTDLGTRQQITAVAVGADLVGGVGPARPNIFIGTENGEFWRSVKNSAGNLTWLRLTPLSPVPGTPNFVPTWGTNRISSITIDPTNPDIVYAPLAHFTGGATNRVWKFTTTPPGWLVPDGAMQGIDISSNLPTGSPVNGLAVDPNNSRVLYVANSLGVYRSVNRGAAWARFGDQAGTAFPNVQVSDLQLSSDKGKLIAATFGRGVYDIDLPAYAQKATTNVNKNFVWTFYDDAIGNANDYSASVHWGGPGGAQTFAPGVGIGVDNTLKLVTVSLPHTYTQVGNFPAVLTVTRTEMIDGTVLRSTVTVANPPPMGNAAPLNGAAFVALNAVPVATLTEPDLTRTANDFAAQIDWGDGTVSTGTVAGSLGLFSVLGSHTYTNAGSFGVTVTVLRTDGESVLVSSQASITGPAAAQSVAAAPDEGVALPLSTLVARFTSTLVGTFTASVNWSNGTTTSATVQANTEGGYDILGGTIYNADGNFQRTVTVQNAAQTVALVKDVVVVENAALEGYGELVYGTLGSLGTTLAVAHFTEASSAPLAGDFEALIDWGNGTTSAGTIVADGNGGFVVSGLPAYTVAGAYEINVAIRDLTGAAPENELDLTAYAVVVSQATGQPTITNISPPSGPTGGGTAVLITGANLANATAVTFGTQPAPFVVNPDGSLTAYAPGGSAGAVDVTVTTPDGTATLTAAFTYVATQASVGASVWIDTDEDGYFDPDESGMMGVLVTLISMSGGPNLITTTDSTGQFWFGDVAPGDYKLHFALPSGYEFTQPPAGGGPNSSTVDPLSGNTELFTLSPGEIDLHYLAGLIPLN